MFFLFGGGYFLKYTLVFIHEELSLAFYIDMLKLIAIATWQAVHGLLLYLLASVHPRAAPLQRQYVVLHNGDQISICQCSSHNGDQN